MERVGWLGRVGLTTDDQMPSYAFSSPSRTNNGNP